MRQCRICFEEDGDMIIPCNCRGTSAYIHVNCYYNYIRHYPDRMCRVCHQYMDYESPIERYLFIIFLTILGTLWFLTEAPIVIKILMLMAMTIVVAGYRFQPILNPSIVLLMTGFIYMLSMHMRYQKESITFVIIISSICTFFTIFKYIDPNVLLFITIIVIAGLYVSLMAVATMAYLDVYGYTLITTLMFLLWNAWVQIRN